MPILRRFFALFLLVSAQVSAQAQDVSQILDRAHRAHGGTAAIEAAGGAVLTGVGRVDLAAMQQGRTVDEPDWWPATQRVVVDTENGTTSHLYDWHNYAFSNQKLFERYDAEGRLLFADLTNGGAFWPPFLAPAGGHERYRRYLPSLLVEEVRTAGTARRVDEGSFTWRGQLVDALDYKDAHGAPLRLFFAVDTGLLVGLSAWIDAELIGPSIIEFGWSDYGERNGAMRPGRLRSWLAGRLLRDLELSFELGVPDELRGLPVGLEPGDPPEDQVAAEDMPIPALGPGRAREVADNVWLLPSVRPGFHMMAFEFPEFVVAVDAPAGWYELEQIPPHQIGRAADGEALTRKYIRTIEQAIPDKPIRYAVLTHHHSDHIGGFRAFAEKGVTFLASEEVAGAVQAAQARNPGPVAPRFEVVDGEKRIEGGDMALRLIELPDGNPKADGFLVAYAEPARVLYATSFIYPVPEAMFPLRESIPLTRWYVDWFDRSGLEPVLHYNVHAQARVQDWQLDAIRNLPADARPTAGS